jgi:thiol-disulfide isomerase/thioredoxin
VIAVAALLIAFHVDTKAQAAIGDYTGSLQKLERSCFAKKLLGQRCKNLNRAPEFTGLDGWINSKPLSLRKLRGKVVLVDFWTYSCINCLRTLPHLRSWWDAYRKEGLVIVGVHTPEFAFEHVASNVRSAVKRLDVTWPVALDSHAKTWNAYRNDFWPAEYLIGRDGRLRHEHFGEGEYAQTESLIRKLLHAPRSTRSVRDTTPTEPITPETYLGFARADRYVGRPFLPNAFQRYQLPPVGQNEWAYGGRWLVSEERALAGAGARLRLHFQARDVYLVMGGHGRVEVGVAGARLGAIRVSGISRLYTLVHAPHLITAPLDLRFSPGISVYSFTFG